MSEHGRAQRRRFRRVVAEHLRIAHVDPGLDHERDDLAHRLADPLRREGRAMQFERSARGFGRGHRERIERLRLAAGNRNLGPDHIDEVPAAGRLLRDGAEVRRPFGDRRLRQAAIVGAGHARVEMDLREAGFDIGAHHVARFAQSLVRRPALPRIGAEMVAAEDDPRRDRRPPGGRGLRRRSGRRRASCRCSRRAGSPGCRWPRSGSGRRRRDGRRAPRSASADARCTRRRCRGVCRRGCRR